MKVTVNARHMDVTDAIKDYIESKVDKFSHFYDNVMSVEVILDIEAEEAVVEIVVQARRKHTFVASHRDEDMYASIDQCVDKVTQQLRRYKDKSRDRHGPSHSEIQDTLDQQT